MVAKSNDRAEKEVLKRRIDMVLLHFGMNPDEPLPSSPPEVDLDRDEVERRIQLLEERAK